MPTTSPLSWRSNASNGRETVKVSNHLIAITSIFCALLAAGSASADILVAVPGPAEGPRAVLAREIRRGVEAAARDINAKGGVMGEPLTVAPFDDKCSEEGGRASADAISKAQAALVIGHPCANAALAAAPLYSKAGMIFMAPAVRHPALTSAPQQATAGLTFRVAGRDDRQGDAAAAWLMAQSPTRSIAIVHDRTAYAKAVAEAAQRRLVALGVTPVVMTIVAGHRDYPEIIEPAAAKDIDALFFAGFPDEAAIILTGLRAKGVKAAMLGTDSLATPGFAERAAADQRTVRVLLPRDSALTLEARAKAALETWASAVNGAATRDASVVQKRLRSSPLPTSQGDITFDTEGDLAGPSYVAAKAGVSSWTVDAEQRTEN